MGRYIAENLSADSIVMLADRDADALARANGRIATAQVDLTDANAVERIIHPADLVVSALPERFGYAAVQQALAAGKHVVDISFWEQDAARIAALDHLACTTGTTALLDSGIAPGFSNALLAHFDQQLDHRTTDARIYVGGIPRERSRGFFAPWSIAGLIEEYQRPALCVRNGRCEYVPALSVTEPIDLPLVGPLEAAITDGLRSLAHTLPHIPNQAEFTLRYPGHFAQMSALAALGYFQERPLQVDSVTITAPALSERLLAHAPAHYPNEALLRDLGFTDSTHPYACADGQIVPRTVARAVLAKAWEMRPEDRDVLVMRVQAHDGVTQYVGDVYAEHTGTASAMALTTGGTAALAARAIISDTFTEPGAYPLECVVQHNPGVIAHFIDGLRSLGVQYTETRTSHSK